MTAQIGEANGQSKLTEADVLNIREWANVLSRLQIVNKFAYQRGITISKTQVTRVVNRDCWKHI